MSSRLTTATVAARIPYVNAAPFYALWNEAPFAVRNLVPRELGREAESGGVDLGLMAVADYLRLEDRFEMVGPMGVAARGEVLSVLLFSREATLEQNALVSVTPETSTSVRLLRLLLGERRGLANVRYVRGLEPSQAHALLAIGDRAMRLRRERPDGFPVVLDLGADWLEWTGLPFVYAVWAVRRSLDPAIKKELQEFLEASLAVGLRNLHDIARQPTDTGWSAEELEAYLERFQYRLGTGELAGMSRFAELLRRNGLLAE